MSAGERRIVIPYRVLRELYVNKKMTTWEIAKVLHCSQNTVLRRMVEYHIPRRGLRKELPLAELRYWRECEGLSLQAIAAKYHCSHTTVGNRLGGGSEKKRQSDAVNETVRQRVIDAYSGGKSTAAVAFRLGLSRWTVIKLLRQAGIPLRNRGPRKAVPAEEMAYLYNEIRLSTTAIASLYGVHPSTVAERLRAAGISLRGHRLFLDEGQICRRYRQGETVAAIARSLHCSYTAVRSRLERQGIYRGKKQKNQRPPLAVRYGNAYTYK